MIVQVVYHKTTSPKTAAATYALAKSLEAKSGLTLLNPTPFYDTDVIAVTNATAKKYGLKIDRRPEEGRQLQVRRLPGVQDAQHLLPRAHEARTALTNASFVPLAGISAYAALDAGTVQAADVFSTDPPLGKGSKYTVLADPKHIDRVPERRADRQGVGREGGRRRVHEDRERGLGEAHARTRSSR